MAEPPGFRPPPTPRGPDQAARTLPADTPTIHDPEASDAGDEAYTGPDLSTGKITPSRISTSSDPDAFIGLVTTAVRIPTLLLNDRRAAGTELWLLEPDDEAMICGPLASIVARHAPMVDGDTSDVIDGMMAGVGFGGYLLKNLQRERLLRSRYGAATVEQPQPAYAANGAAPVPSSP